MVPIDIAWNFAFSKSWATRILVAVEEAHELRLHFRRLAMYVKAYIVAGAYRPNIVVTSQPHLFSPN
jgi:hypothetical protein